MKALEKLGVSPTPWMPDYVDCAVLDKNDRNVLLNTGLCEEANIKLVSAAPDLYEVARALVDDFAKAGEMDICTLVGKAEAALKKAGGAE